MFGKEVYLIGINEDGEKVFLEEPSWDCGWYWGFGYLETYTNNRQITRSRDIQSHSHFQDFDENSSLNPYHVLTDCVLSFEELQILKGLVRQAKQLGEEARGAKEREYKNITDIHEQCISMLRPLR